MDAPVVHVLLVDDDAEDYIATGDMLMLAQPHAYVLDWAASYDEGRLKLGDGDYDAVLVDYDLSEARSGLDLIKAFSAQGYPAPFILYTHRGDPLLDQAALQAGAGMYLIKSETSAFLLERVIRYAIENKKIFTQLQHERLGRGQAASRQLLDAMFTGFALFEVVYNADKAPIDFRIVQVNPAFRTWTGLGRAVLGKTICELLPGIEPYWIESLAGVALSGKPLRITRYNRNFDKRFQLSAIRTRAGRIAAMFMDEIQ